MKLTKELASEILTGLEVTGSFEQYADEPAKGDEDFQDMVDEIADLKEEHGPFMVAALAQYIEDSSEDVRSHELDDFVEEHFKGAGRSVGELLRQHAQGQDVGGLADLFTALDEAGAVDWFDWEDYADSNQGPVDGLNFIVVPTTGIGADSVFLFTD